MKRVNFDTACQVRLTARMLAFGDALLRGIGQVMLQDNSYTGLLFLAGVFYNSTLFGCGVLLGTAVSTATALGAGVGRNAATLLLDCPASS